MTIWPPKESISNLNMKPKGNTPLLLSTRLSGLTLWSVLCSQSLYFNPKSNHRVSALRGELKPLGFLLSGQPVEGWAGHQQVVRLPWENKRGVGSWTAERGAAGTPVALPWPIGGQPHHWMLLRKTKTWTEEEGRAMAKVENAKTRQSGLGSCFISQWSPLMYWDASAQHEGSVGISSCGPDVPLQRWIGWASHNNTAMSLIDGEGARESGRGGS